MTTVEIESRTRRGVLERTVPIRRALRSTGERLEAVAPRGEDGGFADKAAETAETAFGSAGDADDADKIVRRVRDRA